MTNERLSEHKRALICNAAVKHRFAPDILALCNDFAALANDVYNSAMRRHRQQIDALPDGWLPTTVGVKAEFGPGQVYEIRFNGKYWNGYNKYHSAFKLDVNLPDVSRRFREKDNGKVVSTFDVTNPFTIRFDKLKNRATDLEKQIAEAWTQTSATLNKFFSVDKLLEAWPEIEPFTKGVIKQPVPKLPAVPVMQLNNLLGLPVGEDKNDATAAPQS